MDVSTVEIVIHTKTIKVEVPTNLFDLVVELEEIRGEFKAFTPAASAITEILRSLLPHELRPPTARQVSYASTIAKRLAMNLPENALRDTSVCSNFITEYEDQYTALKEPKKRSKKQTSELDPD